MSKVKFVLITYEDHIRCLTGEEAEKWNEHNVAVARLAQLHSANPFDKDPVNWIIMPTDAKESSSSTDNSTK